VKKILFLVSGNGGNLIFFEKISREYNFQIIAVVSDRICNAINFAISKQINTALFEFDRSEKDDLNIIKYINKLEPDFTITNIHKILSQRLLYSANTSFINLHYSLLPAFKGSIGVQSIKMAIEENCQFLGATCHHVEEVVDSGKIIAQGVFFRGEKTDDEILQCTFETGALCLLTSLLHLIHKEKNSLSLNFNSSVIGPNHSSLEKISFTHVFNDIKLHKQ
jgi:phosphoribosylglycinamide formyltransferase-1